MIVTVVSLPAVFTIIANVYKPLSSNGHLILDHASKSVKLKIKSCLLDISSVC